MSDKPNNKKNSKQLSDIADILFEYMSDTSIKPEKAKLDIDKLPAEFEDVGRGLIFLNSQILVAKKYAHELAHGNLKTDIPPSDNIIAAPLKGLHASFSHLTWQAQRVAEGDYNQRVDFMGEFSTAFNDMVIKLEQHEKQNIEEKENLINAIKEITKLQKSLEYANQAQSAFLATMSHEIRTPMNAILGMADIALRDDLTSSVKDYILTIRKAGINILNIINDILDFSKIESGGLEIINADYSLSNLIDDVIDIAKAKAYKTQLRFVVNVDNSIPNNLYGDANRIRQVLLNVLSNAIKYTKEGYVSFLLTGSKLDDDNILLKVEVSDSGIGISQDNIKKLFDKFSRFDSDINKNVEGSGLGLSIVKSLLESMNGTIDVKSTVGKGTKFTIEIIQEVRGMGKLASVLNLNSINVLLYERRQICIDSIINTMEDLNIKYRSVMTAREFYEELMSEKYSHVFLASVLYKRIKEDNPNLKTKSKIILLAEYGEVVSESNLCVMTTPIYSIPVAEVINDTSIESVADKLQDEEVKSIAPDVKILSVDDINTNLIVFEGFLRPFKMQITSCSSGKDAIEIIKKEPYDLVFLDYMMPDMNGIETLKRIKSLIPEFPHLEKIPMVALSANAMLGAEKMFFDGGFDDYLSKPINMDRLTEILTKWIQSDKWIDDTDIDENSEKQDKSDGSDILINGVDTVKGLKVSGSIKDYLNLLKIFYNDGLLKIKEIKSCYDNKNIMLFVIHVHALKSAAVNIGANNMAKKAKALEDAGNNGEIEFIDNNIANLLSDLRILLGDVKDFLDKYKRDKSEPVDQQQIKLNLIKLKTAIDEFDSTVISEATNALNKYTDSDYGKRIETILKNVLNGDDDGAIEIINTILDEM